MIETLRDILVIAFLSVGILVGLSTLVATCLIVRTLLRVLRSAGRTTENLRNLSDTAVEKLGKPFASGTSIGYSAGSVLGFVTGLGRRRRKKGS